MPDKVVASGTLQPPEFARAVRVEIFRNARLPLGVFGVVAALVLFLVLVVSVSEPARLESVLTNTWQAPVLFVGLVGLFTIVASRSAKSQLASSPGLAGEMTYEFSPEGFHITTEYGSSQTSWEALHLVRETKDGFLFYRSKVAFNLVPKRMLANLDDIERLRVLVRSSLGDKARLRR